MGLSTSIHGYNWSYAFEAVTCLPDLHGECTIPGLREIKVGRIFSTMVEYLFNIHIRYQTATDRPRPRVLAEGSSNQSTVQLPSQARLKEAIPQVMPDQISIILSMQRAYEHLAYLNREQFNRARGENDVFLRHLIYTHT